MINLLYHSHTVVPAHLEELSALEVLEPQEQVLAAIDGVLLDHQGRRVSGPTLHDYCIITDARLILWARDYAQHLCYAFPLSDVRHVAGQGLDPIHGLLTFTFAAEDASPQTYSLTLAAQAHVAPFAALAQTAAATAAHWLNIGADPETAALEVVTALGTLIFGSDAALPPDQTPYRWPGASQREPSSPQAGFSIDPTQLPPNTLFTAGRFARSAWDTLRRSLRETDLPFDFSPGSVREFTDAVRAVNDLVQSVVSNPSAQQLAMAFIHRRQGGEAAEPTAAAATPPAAQAAAPRSRSVEMPPVTESATEPSTYREIPLRKRNQPMTAVPAAPAAATTNHDDGISSRAVRQTPVATPDRREIPLRRRTRSAAGTHAAALSGSGDAERESST